MTTFIINTIAAVFRPSVAACAIVLGAAILTVESGVGPQNIHTVKLSTLCEGPIGTVCQAFTF